MIEYVDIHVAFDAPVLRGVNLRVLGGETLAIVGPSGAGKSVLLKTTNALIVPDRGDVIVDGESVLSRKRGRLETIRRRISYVFQNAALFDSLTVFENIAMGLADSVPHDEAERRATWALEEVNLDASLLEKLPGDLSGGMRKRVGIARAIVGEPEIVLYDEPVTGLDPVNTAVVERLVRQIADRAHVTSILVTHDVAGALRMCDRIALLVHGRIDFVGTPDAFRESEDPLIRAFVDADAAASIKLLEEP